MSDSADDLELVYDLGTQAVSFDLHEELYAKEAVYGAAYLFVDRAYVFLTRPGDHLIRVRLRSRDAISEEQLVSLAGEFANELLNQMVRRQVSESTRQIREYTLARAFFGDDGRASIDALLAELDAEELDDDPLEIEVPWERSGQGSIGG